MKKYVIDTNVLIDNPDIINKLIKKRSKVIIPYIVIKELDRLKRNNDISFAVRKSIRNLLENKNHIIIDMSSLELESSNLNLSNDELIILIAKKYDAILLTNDIHMSILAEQGYNIKVELADIDIDDKYEPYHYVNENDIAKIGFTFQNRYEYNDEIKSLLKNFFNVKNFEGWKFLLITNDNNKITYIYALNPIKKVLERIDNNKEYKFIETSVFKVTALDEYQTIAIYALKEAPNILITGKWGSGKNVLSVAYSIYKQECLNKKIFITRPNIGINSKFDIGFLPGNKHDKLIEWSSGFLSALYYIYGNTNGQSDRNGLTYDYVKEVLFQEKFEIIPLNMIQGLSLLENDIMIVDEVQLMSIDYMTMLLSRFSKGSKLIMIGDYKQTYDVVKAGESGLLALIKTLPSKELCWVKLKNSHRSGLIELADKIKDRFDL